MAYIPGFKHDVFISYARLDNDANSEDDFSWIEEFHDKLSSYLDARLGERNTIKLWYDRRAIDEATDFDDAIRDGVAESATMICINSPGYKKSKWCTKERASFVSKIQKEATGLKVGFHKRIVAVHLNNINYNEWPDELEGTTGFPFYEVEHKDDYGTTIRPDDPKKWNREMLKVRETVFKILKNLKEEYATATETVNTKPKQTGNEFSIYLAEVSDTLRSNARKLNRELTKAGYRTLKRDPDFPDAKSHEAEVNQMIDEADLSIHLLDHIEGREIVDEPESFYIMRETEIAFSKNKPQIVWIPEDMNISSVGEPIYQTFLSELELKRPEKEYDYIRGVKNNLSQLIKDQVAVLKDKQQLKQQQHELNDTSTNGPLKVLLDYQIDDDDFARDLTNILVDHNVSAYFAPSAENPEADNERFKDRFLKSQKFVFLCGEAEIDRTTSRLEATLKTGNNLGRWNIGKDIYVYLIPPEKKEDVIPPDKYPINIINKSYPNLNEAEIMEQILSDLKGNKDG